MLHQQQGETAHLVIHDSVDKSVDQLLGNAQVQQAAEWILADEVVAFPTETVYGLGANAYSEEACQKIFIAKGRPSDNPLIVHIACEDQLKGVVDNIPDLGRKLITVFWPGPLTLILPKGEQVCATVTAGLDTVAVRMPDHPLALALIHACQRPLAAPSANRSGRPSPTSAQHVLEDLQGRIIGVLDGGETGIGIESTVVDVTGERAMILRPGGITREQLVDVVGQVDIDPALSITEQDQGADWRPKSPGVKYKHYAPQAPLALAAYQEPVEEMRRKIQVRCLQDQEQGLRVGVLTTDEGLSSYSADELLSLGSRTDLHTVSRRIYHCLRQMDLAKVDRIYAESFPSLGLGEAIMNRLLKAAGGTII